MGQTNEANKLLERSAVIPVRQRLQYVLRCRILAAEKPHVANSQSRESVPRFDLADGTERRRLLRSGLIRAAAAARAKHNCYSLMFVECARKIRRSRALVIGMRHDEENIRFVALVRQRERFRLLCVARRHWEKEKKCKK